MNSEQVDPAGHLAPFGQVGGLVAGDFELEQDPPTEAIPKIDSDEGPSTDARVNELPEGGARTIFMLSPGEVLVTGTTMMIKTMALRVILVARLRPSLT